MTPRLSQILFLLFFITMATSCKKDLLYWEKVQKLNSNTTNSLYRVRFLSNNICIAAGGEIFDSSIVIRSIDGGYTWSAYTNPAHEIAMFGMGISPSGKIYLCGVYGNVLYSNDTGLTWQYGRITDYNHYVGASFPTPDTGVFVSTVLNRGSTITRLDTNFNILSEDTLNFGLNDIYMTNSTTGYAVGYGAVLKTSNLWNTWNIQNVQGDDFTAMDIHGNEIWMCGAAGGIYHTLDGGATWQRQRNGNDFTLPRYYLRSIVFKDEMNGWAVGDNGKVIHSDDGGNHWMEYKTFTTSGLKSIALCPNGDLLVCGDNGSLYRITP